MILAVLLVAGCQTGGEMEDGTGDACGAERYRSLIGTNVAAVTLPAELDFRVIGPGEAVTMDFVETRLNLRTDADGTILEVYCG
jgi:hypothetical protein